jgi:hypothetical protein
MTTKLFLNRSNGAPLPSSGHEPNAKEALTPERPRCLGSLRAGSAVFSRSPENLRNALHAVGGHDQLWLGGGEHDQGVGARRDLPFDTHCVLAGRQVGRDACERGLLTVVPRAGLSAVVLIHRHHQSDR